MKDIENALRELADVQGSQLNELMDLVNQNKEINRGMRVSAVFLRIAIIYCSLRLSSHL